MIKDLFDLKLENNYKVSVTNNEIYYQLLMYIFFQFKKNVVLVTPNLNEANKIYSCLNNRIDHLYIFPDDDYLTKHAIATSPELQLMRMRFLNNIKENEHSFLICHTNSFLKKLPNKNSFEDKNIKLKIGDNISRDLLISKLNNIGYKRESLVTNTGEFSVRGFVLDIFPIFNEHPVRIEFFDETIEEIKIFDENTQLSLSKIDYISIKPLIDEYSSNDSNLLSYLDNPILIYQDYNQIDNVQKNILEQMKYYDDFTSMFQLNDISNDFTLYINTIDNADVNLNISAIDIQNYNNNLEEFKKDLENENAYLCTTDKKFINKIKISEQKVINTDILSGFIFNDKYFYSKNDLLGHINQIKYNTGYKLGKKISSLDKLEIGDYVVHKINGIGVYMGISTITKNGQAKDYILIKYKGDDKLYLSVDKVDNLYKYSSKDGAKPIIHRLNSLEWQKTKAKIRQKIKDISDELLKIYKERNVVQVEPFMKDTPEQAIFENDFIYEETIDQLKCTEEIKKDLESSKPMDRLLCGDVGYGKTEVIFRAMFKAVMNSKQVMYLCPTTLLSYQQYISAQDRFKNYAVNIAVLNRYSTKKEVNEILDKLDKGLIDIIFGTHRLLSSDVKFKDLGLLIIDEEQRFGVMHKEKIKSIKSNVHVLSVSATPIPRSLQMSLIGVRDLSLIETPPKNKFPVLTYVISYDQYLLREIVLKEKSRNGQVFILYNKVMDISAKAKTISALIPEVSIKFAHGKMKKEDMQDIMYDFNNGKFDVLISTTIIENGIDIPNANTIVVMDADKFGLSQLYQIRGRVGRGDRQAYAYLMYDKSKVLTETAVKRLEAIKEFTELGSGYKIAMRDLSIRGAGDLLGREQAGFIDSVGVDMYIDLINEEMNPTIEEENEVIIDDVANHINETYSDEDAIIVELHKKVASIENLDDLNLAIEEIKDRFGHIDEDLKTYMYQELTEKLMARLSIKILINNQNTINIKLEKSLYKDLDIERLFIEATKINTKFNFVYRGNYIMISLSKNMLDKHYIYYLFELVNYIEKNRKV